VGDAAAAVEDEAVAGPCALVFRNLFEIAQDAALQVEDLGEALLKQEGGGLLAADASGAEHGDLFVGGGVQVLASVSGEVGEGFEAWIDGVAEGSGLGFVGVASVEEEDFRIFDEGVPVAWCDVGAGLGGVYDGAAEGEDFRFDLELETSEGWLGGEGELDGGAVKTGAGGKKFEEAIDDGWGCSEGAVDALVGDEEGSAECMLGRRGLGEGGLELSAEGCGVVQGDESVECGDGDGHGMIIEHFGAAYSDAPVWWALRSKRKL
jgi:hypothetical protein